MGQYLKLEPLSGGLALLTFDTPGQKVNTFSSAVLQEFADIVAELAKRTDLRGLLFTSAKPGQFIAGADLSEASSSPAGVMASIERGHAIFSAFSELPFPTIALIEGA